jgi:hypothetical protein
MNKRDTEMLSLLESLGYKAQKIKESDEKTADYLIIHNGFKVATELKTKGDSQEFINDEEKARESEEVHMHFDSTKRNNRLSALVGDAVAQIRSIKATERAEFGLAIFEMLEPYATNKVEKLINTLYGRKFAIPLNTKDKVGRYCYYCSNSEFYRHRADLNCVFVLRGSSLRICVNNLANNYKDFMSSGFLNRFEGKYLDPQKEIDEGSVMVIDSEIDRDDVEKVQQYLCGKYNVEAMALIDFPVISASARIE